MTNIRTVIFSSFSPEDEAQLIAFKKEVFHFVGEDFENYERWQLFFNHFFIYHVKTATGATLAQKHDLEAARIALYTPSFFARLKGEDMFSGAKLILDDDEENSLTWYKERELILSIFHVSGEKVRMVDSRFTFVLSLDHADFFKKLKKYRAETGEYQKDGYLLFLIALLMLKKDRFAKSKLYTPFTMEEVQKTHLYYQKFADLII